jgi:hypothetical protein
MNSMRTCALLAGSAMMVRLAEAGQFSMQTRVSFRCKTTNRDLTAIFLFPICSLLGGEDHSLFVSRL